MSDFLDLDLDAISARYHLARMAGTDADDAGNGWDQSKMNAVVRSWQDVSALHDAYKALLDRLPKAQCHEHDHGEPGLPHLYEEGHDAVLTRCYPGGGGHKHVYGEPVARPKFHGDPTLIRHCYATRDCDHFQFTHDPAAGWTDAAPPRR